MPGMQELHDGATNVYGLEAILDKHIRRHAMFNALLKTRLWVTADWKIIRRKRFKKPISRYLQAVIKKKPYGLPKLYLAPSREQRIGFL